MTLRRLCRVNANGIVVGGRYSTGVKMKRYIIRKGAAMYVSNHSNGIEPLECQPTTNLLRHPFYSTREVEYSENDVTDGGRGTVVFRLPPNEYGEYLVVDMKDITVVEFVEDAK